LSPFERKNLHEAESNTIKFPEPKPNEVNPGKVQGTDLQVLVYPHPALRKKNHLVTATEISNGSAKRLADELLLLMYASQGVGLASPQAGINKRIMVYNPSADRNNKEEEVVFINPNIVSSSMEMDIQMEGCLSFPDMGGFVTRHEWIKVKGLDLKGNIIKRKFVDWEARIFQHEYDHLDGVCYIDRLVYPEDGEDWSLIEAMEEEGEGGDGTDVVEEGKKKEERMSKSLPIPTKEEIQKQIKKLIKDYEDAGGKDAML